MKRAGFILAALVLGTCAAACAVVPSAPEDANGADDVSRTESVSQLSSGPSAGNEAPAGPPGNPPAVPEDTGGQSVLYISVGEHMLTASLADNSSAAALRDLVAQGPVTIDMRDYAGMEKVGDLGAALPTNDAQITTRPGDLILYQGSSFVIYYEANTWSLTRLGRMNNVTEDELREILGAGDVTVTLSLTE